MALGTSINFLQSSEFLVGANDPVLTDTANRALLSLIAKFDSGADTQVARTMINIPSATDIAATVVDDDLVEYDITTGKYIKAVSSNVLGFIDKTNLSIYVFGTYNLLSINTLVPGTKYYLDTAVTGGITTSSVSGLFIGLAFTTNQIFIKTAGVTSSITVTLGAF